MAVNHLAFNTQLPAGQRLRNLLNQGQNFIEDAADELATMALMIDGNGSDSTQFTYMTAKYGFADNATAKAAWDELNSMYSKFSGDGSVTFVRTALLQAFAKFR